MSVCRKEQERIDTLTSEQRRLESHMNSELSVRKARGVFDDMEQYHYRYERSNRLSVGDQRNSFWISKERLFWQVERIKVDFSHDIF